MGEVSLSLTKGQLAGGVIMLVSALVFVGLYLYTFIRALQYDGRLSGGPVPFGDVRVQPQQSWPSQHPKPHGQTTGFAGHPTDGSRGIVCPNCGTLVGTSDRF